MKNIYKSHFYNEHIESHMCVYEDQLLLLLFFSILLLPLLVYHLSYWNIYFFLYGPPLAAGAPYDPDGAERPDPPEDPPWPDPPNEPKTNVIVDSFLNQVVFSINYLHQHHHRIRLIQIHRMILSYRLRMILSYRHRMILSWNLRILLHL